MELFMIIMFNIWTLIIMFNIYICNGSRDLQLKSPKFSAMLVFGDSTMDSGNNNYIKTIVKANFPPYGEDFPGKVATGRFSNGKLIPDFLASYLDIKQAVPPFLDPKLSDNELITGVNFASAASGFDNATNAGHNIIPVSKQIENFKIYIEKLNNIVGEEKAKNIINGALVVISAGTNDVSGKAAVEDNIDYQDFLISQIQIFVQELYELGCRSMIMAGLPPIGCLPSRITEEFKISRKCMEDQNAYAVSYNQKFAALLSQLQQKLPGTKIAYVDVYQQLLDMLNDPKKYGFAETKRGCCGVGFYEMSFMCNPFTIMCQQRDQFIFFDAIHPSQTCYQYLAKYIEDQIFPKFL